MKIETIEEKNFKTLKDVKIIFPTFFNTISGKNNAGKSAIVRIIQELFEEEEGRFPFEFRADKFKSFLTQWESDDSAITICAEFSLSREADAEMLLFIEDLSPTKTAGKPDLKARIEKEFSKKGVETRFFANGVKFDERKSNEIAKN